MSPKKQLEAFAQSIYLVRKGRHFDGIEDEDGKEYIDQVIDWTNMFVEELETTLNPADNQLVDWWFARQNGFTLGTAEEGQARVTLPRTVDRLLTDEERYVQVLQDGIVVSNWVVVHPRNISSSSDRITRDMCAVVGNSIVFSRAFRDTEANGTVIGDVVTSLPRLSTTNVALLNTVKPSLLLKLGVAKNAVLPDIVKGGLTPTYTQKYGELLAAAIVRSTASSVANKTPRQSFSHIRGI